MQSRARALFNTVVGATWVGLLSCHRVPGGGTAHGSAPSRVTAEIQAGIEAHIDRETERGHGVFSVRHGDRDLKMKLVRVHTEYLARLGPERHFACVDLADGNGDVYDVDFFLAGPPGRMTVTETTVHKLNGQPYYAWEQKPDKSWHRIPVEKASDGHFGVLRGTDSFRFVYEADLPSLTAPARVWLPYPASDAFQSVEVVSIKTPGRRAVARDQKHGNRVLILDLGPEDSGKPIVLSFDVRRREKAPYLADLPSALDREPERLVPLTPRFRRTAADVVGGKKSDLARARALFDHVIESMRYMKHGDGWGRGDAVYACDARSGNCTDFHAYFMALARAVGIPARFAIGVGVPSERNEGGIDGYHCWVEFYAEGRWWPVDISEADKHKTLASYYFGHHPANRLELSRGRDLEVFPAPASGPINFLAYPLLEVEGKPVKVPVRFSFDRSPAG